ncbi:MAG: hypothetical protein WCP96_05730 [Methylococcaceae bacterium]
MTCRLFTLTDGLLIADFLPVMQHYLLSILRLLLDKCQILDAFADADDEIICAM